MSAEREKQHFIDYESLLCNVTLLDAESKQDKTIVARIENESNPVEVAYQNLVGQRAILGKALRDPNNGQESIFFIFTDLAIRIPGAYQMRCDLIDLKRYFVLI